MKAPLRAKPATRGIKRIDLAYVQLASSENARDVNRDIVLEIIRSRQPIARADLARASGLQPSTISAIVEQLLVDNKRSRDTEAATMNMQLERLRWGSAANAGVVAGAAATLRAWRQP